MIFTFFECCVLSQPFHSPLSLSSTGSFLRAPLKCFCMPACEYMYLCACSVFYFLYLPSVFEILQHSYSANGPLAHSYGFVLVSCLKYISWPLLGFFMNSRTIKKAECQRIDTFELWCWRRLLRVPWTARRSNQLILKDISLE